VVIESELREKIVQVLQGLVSLEALADWLDAARVDAELTSTPSAQNLAAAVSLLLYEHFEDHLSIFALHDELAQRLNRVRTTLWTGDAAEEFQTAANASSIQSLDPVLACA
jgi:hypothetical protein